MRPPEFTGGNGGSRLGGRTGTSGFNEAAGIHRRKRLAARRTGRRRVLASMRPPEFTGGNSQRPSSTLPTCTGFNEAAGIHRRKLGVVLVYDGETAGLQ